VAHVVTRFVTTWRLAAGRVTTTMAA
jgi:hypothetical protein